MLKIHSVPEKEFLSSIYQVTINHKNAPCFFARVSAMPFNAPWPGHQRDLSQTEEGAFVSFEADEELSFTVKTQDIIKKAIIRPLSSNIAVTIIDDNTLSFRLPKAGNYVLEVNGQHNALHIFFNPPRDFKKEALEDKSRGRTVYYYGAGVHNIGHLKLPSHSTVTIDGGAVVYGSISSFGKKDIKINGYGILDGSKEKRATNTMCVPTMKLWLSTDIQKVDYPHNYFVNNENSFEDFLKKHNCLNGLLRFYFCENVICEGIILRDCSNFSLVPAACNDVTIDRIKTIGMWRYNSDGIDIFNSQNIFVKNCFLRNFDDAMVIKGIAGWDFKNNENILVENCVIWCDWGAALEIGAETNADEFCNITYRDCDLIHDNFGAMMRIHHHNRAKIHNITYENIRAEFCTDQMSPDFQTKDHQIYSNKPDEYQPYILDLFLNPDHLYGRDDLRGNIYDITFKNIDLFYEDGLKALPQIHLNGLSKNVNVDNITLEGFRINGKAVTDINELQPIIEDFVTNIKFK
ncbi:MAG: hypothetical protein E7551_07215 [Ruminococcaceae bacterium]|nr:hypothetical protein [Oscillospiraceae bacterium]